MAREGKCVLDTVSTTYMEAITALDDQILLAIADRGPIPLMAHHPCPN